MRLNMALFLRWIVQFTVFMPSSYVQNVDAAETSLFEWKYSERCLSSYSDDFLDKVLPAASRYQDSRACKSYDEALSNTCEKVIHSCSNSTLAQFNISSPRALEWSEVNEQELESLWRAIYTKSNHLHILLIGDSLLFQLMYVMYMYLYELGYSCTHDGCPNGMKITRKWVGRLNREAKVNEIVDEVSIANISIVNLGHHYAGDDTIYGEHVAELFTNLNEINVPTAHIAWIDTLRPHFPSFDGSYYFYANPQQTPSEYSNGEKSNYCQAVHPQYLKDQPEILWVKHAKTLVTTKFLNIKLISVNDIVQDRYDMHTGYLTWFDTSKLDCTHLCIQKCFWEPILLRVGRFILNSLS